MRVDADGGEEGMLGEKRVEGVAHGLEREVEGWCGWGEEAQVDAVVGVGGVRMVVGIVGILRAGSGLGVREPLQLVLLSLALLGVDRRSSR